jgi:hypothetical protein
MRNNSQGGASRRDDPRRAAPGRPSARGEWTLHQLRHSSLTHEAEDGTNTPTLLARSRHASVRSLERYAAPASMPSPTTSQHETPSGAAAAGEPDPSHRLPGPRLLPGDYRKVGRFRLDTGSLTCSNAIACTG